MSKILDVLKGIFWKKQVWKDDGLFNDFGMVKTCPYKIIIPLNIWQKIFYYATICKYEIGGHVETIIDGSNIIIKNIYLPKQKVGSSEYVPSSKYLYELAKRNPKVLSGIKGWFHSHVSMNCFWSGTDEETIKNNLEVFHQYCVSLVINKLGEYKIRLDVKEKDTIESYDDLPLYITNNRNSELFRQCKTDVKNKVEKNGFVGWIDGFFKPVEHFQPREIRE